MFLRVIKRSFFFSFSSFLFFRVPLTPSQVKTLIDTHNFRVLIQPSSLRIFSDEEYSSVGAEIQENLSEACLILGIKKMSVNSILPSKSYMFFCHIIKAQEANVDVLDKLIASQVNSERDHCYMN